MMKKLTVLLLIAVFTMGVYDGGDVTGAVVLGMMFLPGLRCESTGNKRKLVRVFTKGEHETWQKSEDMPYRKRYRQ